MKIEDYNEYYIQNSNHYLIPKDVFIELFEELENWKEESKILRENAENNDKVVDNVNWENMLLKKENQELKKQLEEYKNPIKYFKYANKNVTDENKKLKDNWNKLKEYIRKNIIYDDVGMKILDPSPLEDYIAELEQGSDSDE